MLRVLILLSLFPQQSDNLLDAVNSERGGRHWIDQQPDPPKSPEASQACFQIEPGSRIELVAAEPLVVDPVWIDFDHLGRMFVVEYTDYPIGPVKEDGTEDTDAAPLSKIVLLEDTDDDGRMDKRTVFADQLQFCHSLMPLMGGILAGARTEILFLKDTDGDGVADVREVWFDGFTPAHPQMQIGCPRYGLDNWVYLTYAPGNVRCRRPGFETDKPVKMPRQDMRFNPRTMEFEPISGLGQFGNTIDNDGHRFFCTNRNPIMMEVIPQNVAARNPFVTVSKRHADVGPSGGDTKVFPLVEMKSNWLAHAGTHTSACGVTAYRGDLWDEDFQHSVFACEPVGHLVTRSIVTPQPDSPVLTARRARPDADFLASSDTWFRPASLRTGPNGALFVADMYRMWVEHPKFLPPEIAAQIDWRAGEDKGRIWRIVPVQNATPAKKFTPTVSTRDLVRTLKDPNGWRRQTAQRLLVESTENDVAEQLRRLLASPRTFAQAATHAIRCLQGRGELSCDDIGDQLFQSRKGRDQWANLRLDVCDGPDRLFAARVAAQSSSAETRFRAVLACANMGPETEQQLWAEVLMPVRNSSGHNSWFQDALLIHSGNSPQNLLNVVSRLQRAENGEPPFSQGEARFLFRISELAGRSGREAEIATVISDAAKAGSSAEWMTAAILKGLAAGMRRNSDRSLTSLAAFLGNPPESAAESSAVISGLLGRMADVAVDTTIDLTGRKAAVEMLTLQPRTEAVKVIEQLLVPGQSGALQETAIEVLRQIGGEEGPGLLLSRWNSLAPGVRSAALSLLMARTGTTSELLQRMVNGTISSSVIAIDQRVRLLQHRDENIRELAGKVFGGVVSANRKEVADRYRSAVTAKGSVERGAAVFEKTCSKCHKVNGKGHNVGPDISDTRRRSRDALLYDILDPNRRVDPQFTEYIVITTDGRSFNGLLVSNTSGQIVLRQPEGKEQIIDRSEVEEMQATSKSLMPEGVEKDVSVEQMADLLEFLKAR